MNATSPALPIADRDPMTGLFSAIRRSLFIPLLVPFAALPAQQPTPVWKNKDYQDSRRSK